MSKLLLVVVIGLVVWWMWRKLQAPSRDDPPVQRPAELMVSCAFCGVNQPRSESVECDGRYYCSEAHRREAESGRGS